MSRTTLLALQVLVAVVCIAIWHIFSTYSFFGVRLLPPFFFSNPVDVAARVVKWFVDGTIWKHLWITLLEAMLAFARAMRPLFSRAVAEHEALIAEAAVGDVLRKNGWLKIYRNGANYEAARRDLEIVAKAGITFEALDQGQALKLVYDMPHFHRI